MPEIELTIQNRRGLHARASSKLVQTASRFAAKIEIAKDGEAVQATSIMGLMMLAAAYGSRIMISAEGADAQAALDALAKLVNDKFGEETDE